MVGRTRNVHVHQTHLGALAARNAFALVNLNPQQRHLVHERIKRTEGADPFAEGAVEQHAQHRNRNENRELPGKELSQRGADSRIHDGQRNRTLEHALWADVLAKERVAHAHIVDHQDRQQHHGKQQHGILDVRERLKRFRGELFAGNLVKQLLKPAKRAQKAAYKASQQHAEQNERTGYVVGKVELG